MMGVKAIVFESFVDIGYDHGDVFQNGNPS